MRTRQKRVATDTWRSQGCRTTPPQHFLYGERKANILLCQLNKSQLNQDLFNYNLNDSPNCITCNSPETSEHFLFLCPKFATERMNLFHSLISNPEIYSKISICSNDMLKGNSDLSNEEKCVLLNYVLTFIKQTNRLLSKIMS